PVLNRAFDRRKAEKDLKRYYKKGIDKEGKVLFDFLKNKMADLRVLDIGCGIGNLAIELVKAGASNSRGVDISEAYIAAARNLAKNLDIADIVEFQAMDFVENERKIEKVDVVVSNKVICCYPYMERFIRASTSHAKKFYAITYPVDHSAVRFFVRIRNWFIQFTVKRGFKVHIHNVAEITKCIESQGFKGVFSAKKRFWIVDVFERRIL
ncbi:MAG: class I SAM-dependent methyltransferase, partial [Nitrososphaerales archaeon]